MTEQTRDRDPGASACREAAGPPAGGRSDRGLQLALRAGAGVWCALLVVGFLVPGGWTWGMAGPIGHIENYMISFWLVALVLAPLLSSIDPVTRTSAVQIYLLGVLGVVVSTFRGEPLKLIADGPPLVVAATSIAVVVLAHPARARLFRW